MSCSKGVRALVPSISTVLRSSLVVATLIILVVVPTLVEAQQTATHRIMCCTEPAGSCTFQVDSPMPSLIVALAEECNHPNTGIILAFSRNDTKFLLRNSVAKFVRLEQQSLQNVEITIEHCTLESFEISGMNPLQQSTLSVRNSSLTFSRSSTVNHSAVSLTSSTLSAVSLTVVSSSVDVSGFASTRFITLDRVVANGHTSITIDNVAAKVQSTEQNATGISIGNSLLTDGFKINTTSWSNEATTSSRSSGTGTAGLLAVHSQSTINGGTKFLFENVTSTAIAAGTSARAFGLKLIESKVEPSDVDSSDSQSLEVSFNGILVAKTETSGPGEGVHLFHFHDNVVLRNVAIKGSPPAHTALKGNNNWTAVTLSGFIVQTSLITLRGVKGSNVSVRIDNVPITLTSTFYTGVLMVQENVAINALSVELAGVDITVDSRGASGCLVYFGLSTVHTIELRNLTLRIDGAPSSTSGSVTPSSSSTSPSATVKIHSKFGSGCFTKKRGSLASTNPALWRNLTIELSSLNTFHCSSDSDTRLIDFTPIVNAAPVGTTVRIISSIVTFAATQASRSALLFVLNGIATDFSVSLHNSSVDVSLVGTMVGFVYSAQTTIMRSPKILTVSNSVLQVRSLGGNGLLGYDQGKMESDTKVIFHNSSVAVQGVSNSFVWYRFARTDVAHSQQRTVFLTITDCNEVRSETTASSGGVAGILTLYFVPVGLHHQVSIKRSKLYSRGFNIGQSINLVSGSNQAGSSSGTTEPSINVIKIEDSQVEIDTARSIVIRGNPTATIQNINMTIERSTFEFRRRLATIIDKASVVMCERCLKVNVQFHENNVSVPNKEYRGAPLIDLKNPAIPTTPCGHVINVTKSKIVFDISKSYNTATDSVNQVSVAAVTLAAGPVLMLANDIDIDYSVGPTLFGNAFFELRVCSPNCEMNLVDINVSISKAEKAKSVREVTLASVLTSSTVRDARVTLRNVNVTIIEAYIFYGVLLLGNHFDTTVDVSDFKARGKDSNMLIASVFDVNDGVFSRLNAKFNDISVTGNGWTSFGQFSTATTTSNPFLVDSHIKVRNVAFDTFSVKSVRFWIFARGRDMRNTSIDIAHATLGCVSQSRADLLEMEVNANQSFVSLQNVTVKSVGNHVVFTSVYWGDFRNSTFDFSDITALGNAAQHIQMIAMKESTFSEESSVNLRRIHFTGKALSSTSHFLQLETCGMSQTVNVNLVGNTASLQGRTGATYIVLYKSTVSTKTFNAVDSSVSAVAQTSSAFLFYIYITAIGNILVENVTSPQFYGATEVSLFQVRASNPFQQTLPRPRVQFRNVSFPDVYVGHNAAPRVANSSSGASRKIATRYITIINHIRPENIDFFFDRLHFVAKGEDMSSNGFLTIFHTHRVVHSMHLTVKRSNIKVVATNTTLIMSGFVSKCIASDSRLSFEDSSIDLKSELGEVSLVYFQQMGNLTNTSVSLANVNATMVSGGNYILSVATMSSLATSGFNHSDRVLPLVIFEKVHLGTYFLRDDQRSPVVRLHGDDGSGNITTRLYRAALVSHYDDTAERDEDESTLVHFEDVTWSTILSASVLGEDHQVRALSTSPPNTCLLNLGLSRKFHLLFSNVNMRCKQEIAALNVVQLGNVEFLRSSTYASSTPSSSSLVGNFTVVNSHLHVELGNNTADRVHIVDKTTEQDNVTAVISYEVGYPAVLDIVNTGINVVVSSRDDIPHHSASSTPAHLLWAWAHSEPPENRSSLYYPQLTFSGSTFAQLDQLFGHSINVTSENMTAQPPQIRLNCSAFNGKRLTAVPSFSDVLPLSAVMYWPHSLLDQEHLVCPFSTTASPTFSGSPSLTSSSSLSKSETISPPPSVTPPRTVTPSFSGSPSLTVTVSPTPPPTISPSLSQSSSPTGSPSLTMSSTRSRSNTVSPSRTISTTSSESLSLSPNTTFTMELTQSLSATETVTASAGNVSVSCSAATASTSQTMSRTPSTTLVHALPRCHHAHIQLVLLEDGSEADKQLLFDREFEPDSAHRNVTDRPEVSLSTLQGTEMSAYLFLTNDTAASWTSLATESGRVRLLCDAGDSSSGCASSLRSALRTTPIVAEQLSPFLLKLRLGPYSGFDIEGSSTLLIQIGEAVVGCSEMPASQYAQDFRVTVPEVAEVAVQAAATSTIAAASVVGAAASPAMLMDAQSLATFSLISCSSGSDRYAMQPAMFLLSPFSLGPEPDGYVWTNILLLFLILLPFVAVLLFTLRKNPSGGLKDPCTTARFPSMYYSIAMVFHQGTAVLSMRMLFDGRWSGASVLGSLWSVLFPALIYLTFRFKVAREVVNIESEDKLIFYRYDDEVSWSWPDNAVMRWAKRYAFPVGRWGPSSVRKRFGGPISPVLPTWTLYATLPLVQAVLVSFVASIHAGSMTGCMCQYAVLTIFFVCFGVAVTVLKPYRAGLLNAFQAASYFLLASILVCSAALAYSSKFSSARSVLSGLMMLQMGLSVVRTVYLVPLKLGEIFLWGKFCMTTEYNALRDNNQTQSLFFEAFGGVDEEMLVAEQRRRVEWRDTIKKGGAKDKNKPVSDTYSCLEDVLIEEKEMLDAMAGGGVAMDVDTSTPRKMASVKRKKQRRNVDL